MTYFHGDKAKKKILFLKRNSKWPTQKQSFSTLLKAEQFPPKFHGLVIGLVELIDVKGIDMAQFTYMILRFSDVSSKTA